jgi:hypothetical protein
VLYYEENMLLFFLRNFNILWDSILCTRIVNSLTICTLDFKFINFKQTGRTGETGAWEFRTVLVSNTYTYVLPLLLYSILIHVE